MTTMSAIESWVVIPNFPPYNAASPVVVDIDPSVTRVRTQSFYASGIAVPDNVGDPALYGAAAYVCDPSRSGIEADHLTAFKATTATTGVFRYFVLAQDQDIHVDMFGALPVVYDDPKPDATSPMPTLVTYANDPIVIGGGGLVGNNAAIQAAIDFVSQKLAPAVDGHTATAQFLGLKLKLRPGTYYCYGLTFPAHGLWMAGVDTGWELNGLNNVGTRLKLPTPVTASTPPLVFSNCVDTPDNSVADDPKLVILTADPTVPLGAAFRNLFLEHLVFDGGGIAGSKLVYVDPTKTIRTGDNDDDIYRFSQMRTRKTAFINADYGYFIAGGYDMIHENFHVDGCKVVGFLGGDSVSNVYIDPDIGLIPSGPYCKLVSIEPLPDNPMNEQVLVTVQLVDPGVDPDGNPDGFVVGDMVHFNEWIEAPFTNEWAVVCSISTDPPPETGQFQFYLKAYGTSSFPKDEDGHLVSVGPIDDDPDHVATVRVYAVGAWLSGVGDLVLGSSTSAGGSGVGSVLWRTGYSPTRSPWHCDFHTSAYAKFESCHFEAALGAMVDVCSHGNIVIEGATTCNISTTGYIGAINYQELYGVSRVDSVRFSVDDSVNSYTPHIRVQSYDAAAFPKLFIAPFAMIQSNNVDGIPTVNGLSAVAGLNYVLGRLGVRLVFQENVHNPLDPVQSPQIISSGSFQDINFRVTSEDLNGLYLIREDTPTNIVILHFVAPVSDGIYIVSGKIYLTKMSSTLISNIIFNIQIGIKNSMGVIGPADRIIVENSMNSYVTIPFEFVVPLKFNQEMYIQVSHNAAVNLTIPRGQQTSAYIRLSTS